MAALLLLAADATGPVAAQDHDGGRPEHLDDRVQPGEFLVEPPTLNAISFQWFIGGDDNRDAEVSVRYRQAGTSAWREALPLFRLQNELVDMQPFTHVTPNMFAGSIFDLEPDTAYEVVLTMTDPDGVRGNARRRVTVRTRPVPQPYEGGNVYNVYPPGWSGPRQQPAFTGLLAAYNTGAANSTWYRAYEPRVQPGDTIVVHPGLYRDNRVRYTPPGGLGTPFDGTYFLTAKGTEERPITIMAAEGAEGEVIFDGDGNHTLFNLMAADHHHFHGITIRNTDVAMQAGVRGVEGAEGIVVTNSRFENVGIGVHTDHDDSKNFYVADNTFIGRHDPTQLMGWSSGWNRYEDWPALIHDFYAVRVFGQGHVIAYNDISHFHDGITHATRPPDGRFEDPLRDRLERMSVSIDIHNNDIYDVGDNCIEGDGAVNNIRILRNRCFNNAHRALAGQPIAGGPAYYIRNVVYHAPEGAIKFISGPSGVVVYNNTLIGGGHTHGVVANIHMRNNLVLGQEATWETIFDPRSNHIWDFRTQTNYSSSDYNGFRPDDAPGQFRWRSPPFDVVADFDGPLVARTYQTLEQYSEATGQDRNSVLVDYDVFVDAEMPAPARRTLGNLAPVERTFLYEPEDVDLRLAPGSVAIDAGVHLPNVTDGFSGEAPDLGAYEFGEEVPHYGPRN